MSVFTGVGVALITPFKDDKVNYSAYGELIDNLIAAGVDSLCTCGTTGEPSTMTAEEKREVIKFAIERVAGRVPVIAGCGCNDTAHTVENALEAQALGADALLVVTPYYNKCTQGGLVAHYKAISDAVDIPVIAYNVPGRTGVNILPKTAAKIAELKNVVAIKEASGNVSQLQELIRLAGDKMDVYLGEDALTYVGMTLGAKGVISVAANVVPKMMCDITNGWMRGEIKKACDTQIKLLPLIDALFSEVNPIPVKKAMNYLGLEAGVPRLPLTEMEDETAAKLLAEMVKLGLNVDKRYL